MKINQLYIYTSEKFRTKHTHLRKIDPPPYPHPFWQFIDIIYYNV